MTRNEIRRKLNRLQDDGAIDRWKEVRGPSGYLLFYVQADNQDEWHLYFDEEDL